MEELFFLKDKPEHLPKLAKWFFEEWAYLYPERTLRDVEKKLEEYLSVHEIPLSLILCKDESVLATASLCAHDMETRMHLTPWLESVYVAKDHRKKGLGERVVLATMSHAKSLGIRKLYLYTPDQENWYAKMGFRLLERCEYRGTSVSIMVHDLNQIKVVD